MNEWMNEYGKKDISILASMNVLGVVDKSKLLKNYVKFVVDKKMWKIKNSSKNLEIFCSQISS